MPCYQLEPQSGGSVTYKKTAFGSVIFTAKVGIADFAEIDVVKIFLGITVDNDLRV